MSKWVLTTLGKQRYPIFVQVDNPNYTPSKEDIVVNEATFFKNKIFQNKSKHNLG